MLTPLHSTIDRGKHEKYLLAPTYMEIQRIHS